MALQEAEEEEEAAIIALQVCLCGGWCMCDACMRMRMRMLLDRSMR